MILTARTDRPHQAFVAFDRHGHELVVVVVKSTYAIQPDASLVAAEQQVPVFAADQFNGEPALSSVRYESDLIPPKPGIDLLVNGTAYSAKPTRDLQVELQTRHFRKTVQVIGDRVWVDGPAGLRPSAARSFHAMPITYERAFGGVSRADGVVTDAELRNPVGIGFASKSPRDGTPLPNIEDPAALISQGSDHPSPTGFSAIAKGWEPRIRYAGTYDAEWRETRFPLVPGDFQERFFLCAPASQVMRELATDEPVLLRNLTPSGQLRIEVPAVRVPVVFRWDRHAVRQDAEPDTMIVEPDERRVIVVTRTAAFLGQRRDALKEVIVGELNRAEERAILLRKRYAPLNQLPANGAGGDAL